MIDPTPRFEVSPLLYMQFMEPLGVTDASVEACWDYNTDDWRKDFVETVEYLAPQVIRWGGIYTRYYKWREGVGPARQRPLARNYVWGGRETNRVGTHEFVNLCRRTGAEPLIAVNFRGDGIRAHANTPDGDRTGDATEAADWVSYANDPDHPERRAHGAREPYNIKLWQLGNETSYGKEGFALAEAIRETIAFARAMKQRDPSLRLIGWGDRGVTPAGRELWARPMLEQVGEYLDYIAFHMMGQTPQRPDTVLRRLRYQREPERAWEELREISDRAEQRVTEMEQLLDAMKSPAGIAITEGHLSLPPHNSNPILLEWLSAVYHARSMNIYLRHGARVKITTGADFAGTRWTVNAVLLQVPGGISYLTPVGSIMALFRNNVGTHGITVKSAPPALDVAATAGGERVFLHVLNTDFHRAAPATMAVLEREILSGRVLEIAPDDPREYANPEAPDVFRPSEKALPPGPYPAWSFPPRSVSVVELQLKRA